MTAVTPETLQPLSFALRGSRLIEASAGTGKTFTIAALYLRLVLGHGGDAAFARPLTPPEILVVTFTEAATGELRDRIRARLAEASDRFLADPADVPVLPPGRDFLHDLRNEYPPEQWAGCARRLRLAADWMDEAAVSTIHGWCNRMLREHAFDSDSLFTQTLEADQSELLAEVIRDYWRTFYYPLDMKSADVVRQWWATPEALHAAIGRLLDLDQPAAMLPVPADTLDAARAESTRVLGAIKQPWARWVAELETMLNGLVAAKQVDGRKLQARFYKPWLDALSAWAQGDHVLPLDDKSTGWTRLTVAGLAETWKGSGAAPSHPALDDMASLRSRLNSLPDGREEVLRHAIQWVAARFAVEQERRAEMGFNDLLTRLDEALQGANGERLAALIRRQFPVAMIDEFQDTDPVQYRIFDAIYGVAANGPDTALVLIGDPKQAIYAFRGADIHTYLTARRDTQGRHATLGTNFRSTNAMVQAVNHMFGQAEQRTEGNGAFLFREASGNRLPFMPVDAQGRDDHLWIAERAAPALNCWWLDEGEVIGSGAYTVRMSDICAGEIVRLLRLGQQGEAGFASTGRPLRPLVAGDIAVLVNNGREASALRRALAAGGVRSVYLSDKESVFNSPVATDLQRWLEACAEPDDGRLLRAALATATLGLAWHELDRLNHDELHWDDCVMRWRDYLQCWRRQGVLPMLRRLLNDFAVPRRLLAAGDERRLTDVLHLAELLQGASASLDGEHALVRYLAEQRADAGGDNDIRQVRLESDANLVKVVTVHKSKGLEYPLVFLPFASAVRVAKPTDMPLKWHDHAGVLQVALTPDDASLVRVDAERLGEDLRKLYVALTRARYATWIGVALLSGCERSALGYLLAGGSAIEPGTLATTLNGFKAGCEHLAVVMAPAPGAARYEEAIDVPLAVEELPLPQRREPWWIASYSALRTVDPADPDGVETAVGQAFQGAGPGSASEEIYAEGRDVDPSQEVDVDPTTQGGGLHGFPRGASPGTFLHGLLEWAGREGFVAIAAEPKQLLDQIARRCNVQGWSEWIAPLNAWLQGWVKARLALGDVQVCPQALGRVRVEMEFWFPTTRVDTRALDATVRRHTLVGAARPTLEANQLNGMLKGFIDLVFEHEGRFYVADYKSNWLGPRDEDYTALAMREAVLDHRYELQYALYIFALHRLLRLRLPDYDYDRHIGGAACIFLRGHAAETRGVHFERPAVALIDDLERLFTGAEMADREMQS